MEGGRGGVRFRGTKSLLVGPTRATEKPNSLGTGSKNRGCDEQVSQAVGEQPVARASGHCFLRTLWKEWGLHLLGFQKQQGDHGTSVCAHRAEPPLHGPWEQPVCALPLPSSTSLPRFPGEGSPVSRIPGSEPGTGEPLHVPFPAPVPAEGTGKGLPQPGPGWSAISCPLAPR